MSPCVINLVDAILEVLAINVHTLIEIQVFLENGGLLPCSNRSYTQLEFYRLPIVITNLGEQCQKLSEQRGHLWLYS